MLKSALQVKNVPPELHEELRRRAAAEGKTVGEVILASLRRDLRRQSMRDWLERVAEHRPDPPLTREQVAEIMRESRREMFGEDDLDDRP
jgi:plasmid stability protein